MNASTDRYRDRLDPDAWAAAQALAATMPASIRELGVAAARRLLATPRAQDPLTPLDQVEDIDVSTRAGGRRARVYRPAPATRSPALLYLHGGGFVLGTLDGVDELCRAVAAGSGWTVVSLDYRLAPEHPYPAALHDCIDAYAWLRETGPELGIDATLIAVGGDSAGGNLAAALCLAMRDTALAPPASQVLAYPAVDDTCSSPSWTEFADAPLLTSSDARWLMERYRGLGYRPGADPLAAPMSAESLTGLPPALVLTADVDPLRDDGEAYARRLREHGVAVTAIRYPGVFHGFLTEVGVFAKTERAIADVCRHLRGFGAPDGDSHRTLDPRG